MTNFNSIAALDKWLNANGVDTSSWGTGNTKRLVDLWNEVVAGETQLLSNPPTRTVTMVQIRICREDFVLTELEQEFGNGQRRKREFLPSEKTKRGEHYLDAALRCLREELAVLKENVILEKPVNQPAVIRSDSPSYPGLYTRYTIYQVEAHVKGLPGSDFWVKNVAYGPDDPVKQHRWGWRPEQ